MPKLKKFDHNGVLNFLNSIFKEHMHAKRVLSLANATLGVLCSASLGVYAIGQGLAHARGLVTKHAVKQVDRLLSNAKLDVNCYFADWVPYLVGSRDEIIVSMDWTEFDADDHSTISINLTTRHGRATPLIWKTVRKSELKNNRNRHERELLFRFKEVLPQGVKVTVLADRGFGYQEFFDLLKNQLGFEFVIRLRGNITVTDNNGESRIAEDWVGKGGRARVLKNAHVTLDHCPVGAVVCVKDKGMKEAWCLVTSSSEVKARSTINLYAKRWPIECTFRDVKDPHYGMGMKQTRIESPERRDRLLLISALAIALLTLLGAAGESIGHDRYLKVNTVKYRVHSLFRQGTMYYELIPTMPEERLRPLMEKFSEMLKAQPLFDEIFGII